MKTGQLGVIIEKGPKDWQIIQQRNGYADISLSGRYVSADTAKDGKVYIRLVLEDTGDGIVNWTECEYCRNHKWKVILKNIPAGGLYRLETCLNFEDNAPWSKEKWVMEWALRGDMIHHIGVGDLFVIAGQSNASGFGKDPIFDPPEVGVHLLKNNGRWDIASHPLNDSTGMLHIMNREAANPGHSPYLSCGRMLKRYLGYPIGLVQASLGASPLSRWNPHETGDLYENMLHIVKSQGGAVNGIFWYHGCADTEEGLCETYADRFEDMVMQWRWDLNSEDLSFLTVQLNRSIDPGDDTRDIYWGKLREAQRECAKRIAGVFIIPSTDCTVSDFIHNNSASNMILGERLAKAALHEIYHMHFSYKAPNLSYAQKTAGNRIHLHFDNVKGRLYLHDTGIEGVPFTIIDKKGRAAIKDFGINHADIWLTLERRIEGKCFVHGAFEKNPRQYTAMDSEGHLPMLSFYGVEVKEENHAM